MLMGYRKFLDKEIFDTNHDDCIYSMLCLVNGYYIIPSRRISIDRPKELDRFGMHQMGMVRTDKEVVRMFERKFQKVMGNPFKEHLFNLVIWDSYDKAGDNGEQLYRRVRELYPWMKMTYLISNRSQDWNRLKNDGFCLYPMEGHDLPFLIRNASYILWTKDLGNQCKDLTQALRENISKSVFLQHGVTSEVANDDFYFINYISRFASYVCCTSDHEEEIVRRYSRNRLKTLVFGFPRHDSIREKMMINRKDGDGRRK